MTISWALAHEHEVFLDVLRVSLQPVVKVTIPLMSWLFGSPVLTKLLGPRYLADFWDRYLGGICSNREWHFPSP